MALGFVSNACTDFLGSCSLWMYTLLSLDVVGRALDLAQSRVPCPPLGLEGDVVGVHVEGMGGEEGVEIWIGIFLKNKIIF